MERFSFPGSAVKRVRMAAFFALIVAGDEPNGRPLIINNITRQRGKVNGTGGYSHDKRISDKG